MSDQQNDDQDQADQSELRYFIGGEENGTWTVYDRRTNQPAALHGRSLAGIDFEVATELLDLMNQIEEDQKQRPPIE